VHPARALVSVDEPVAEQEEAVPDLAPVPAPLDQVSLPNELAVRVVKEASSSLRGERERERERERYV